MRTRVTKVAKPGEVAAAADEAARALRAGGIVAFPTETVYGLGGLAANKEVMARLRRLKSRPARPFSVHLARPQDGQRYVQEMPHLARRLIAKGWPGPITLVVPAGGRLADPKLRKAGLYQVLCKDDRIGLRCPDQPVAQAMLAAVDSAVVAPSANPAGQPSPRTAEEVLAWLDGRIDLLIDGGPTRYGLDSTIVFCDAGGWRVLRKGVYDERTIRRLLGRRLLFVCTGNTCRSPMAAGLAKKMLAERLGCSVSELRKHGVEVLSAGVAAAGGRRPSPEAVHAANQRGANIARHRSRKLTAELIHSADMIFCMTDSHVATVCRLVPSSQSKVVRLDAARIVADPIGGDDDVYARTAEQIRNALEARLDRDIP